MGLAGTLPPNQANGWLAILGQLAADPATRRRAVIEFDVLRRVVETDTEQIRPVIRIRQVEVATDADTDARAVQLLDDLQAARTGQPMLPAGAGDE
jgi:hypothetical protein